MCDNESGEKPVSRRRVLGTLGLLATIGVLGTRWRGGDLFPAARASDTAVCALAPELTIGPYFVDERLYRSDITTGTGADTVFISAAVPLTLTINAFSASDDCMPLQGVQIDVWHCHAGGLYSDEAANGTSGQTWLRGYQMTDADGNVSFATVYPGWYRGRTIHIHVMARWFDANGNTTYEFTTQLFFDESVSDAVLGVYPYNTRGTRDTTNGNDSIYAAPMLVDLQPAGAGYTGTVMIGLDLAPEAPPELVFDDGFEAV